MTTPEYTPGEWVPHDQGHSVDINYGNNAKTGGYTHRVCSVLHWGDSTLGPSRDEGIANAHLIAAAPDMYQTLEHFVKAYEEAFPLRTADFHDANCECLRCSYDHALHALDNARGKS
jgi:hypothetical protein